MRYQDEFVKSPPHRRGSKPGDLMNCATRADDRRVESRCEVFLANTLHFGQCVIKYAVQQRNGQVFPPRFRLVRTLHTYPPKSPRLQGAHHE